MSPLKGSQGRLETAPESLWHHVQVLSLSSALAPSMAPEHLCPCLHSGGTTGRTAAKAEWESVDEWKGETVVTDQSPGSLFLPL